MLTWIDPFKVWYSNDSVTLNAGSTGLFAVGRRDGGWSTQDGEPLAVLRVVEDWQGEVYIALDNRRLLFFRCLKVMGLCHKVPVELCQNSRQNNVYYSGTKVVISDHWNVTERQFVGSLKADTSALIGIQTSLIEPAYSAPAASKPQKAEVTKWNQDDSKGNGKKGKGSGKKQEDDEWKSLEKALKKLQGKWRCNNTMLKKMQNHQVSLDKDDPYSASCETTTLGTKKDEKPKQIYVSDDGYIMFGQGNIVLDTENMKGNTVTWYDWKRPEATWEWLKGWEKDKKEKDGEDTKSKSEGKGTKPKYKKKEGA